ncbi:metalloregulator ArsR/SmtB family transcription factor [Zobellella taiwanensis]|uniref:Transcriptional regulator n=1 Tax=Zobellella taiwanensis TaxID=347535 RepID=A0A2P7QWY8_9GAMM|nr:metalloregulator ArsR/SmtB family transcription factor [Zobellella taiwanensis]PSJ42487.1 transcriptional regulator [Zobellella taiwanensis]
MVVPAPLRLFKSLSDDTRLKLVLMIMAEQEMCVCEMAHALDESQPKISRHLALLRQNGLLADRREGQWVYYRLAPGLDPGSLAVLRATLEHFRPYIDLPLQRLARMGNRPERQRLCC